MGGARGRWKRPSDFFILMRIKRVKKLKPPVEFSESVVQSHQHYMAASNSVALTGPTSRWLSPKQAREALRLEKDRTDTLRHMAWDGILKRIEAGRYMVATG
jgi:hypothetical protein